jgi:mycofactocin precursor
VTTTHHPAVPRPADPDADGTESPTGEPAAAAGEQVLVEDELLVEDVSIDGMCGVY